LSLRSVSKMRILSIWAVFAMLVAMAYAWTKEDHEIFDLVSGVEASEGKGTNFYSWLDVSSTASSAEIGKAYRRKSMVLHPDKNPGVKGISERFARLGVVAQILRNSESRERYDFFYKNGVPTWRGTGYYYSRFRPGLGSVFVFLVILTSGLQYMVQKMNYNSDMKRIQDFVKRAQEKAWGPSLVPLEGRRKVRVPVGKSRYDSEGELVQGKMLEMVVDPGAVYILDADGELLPLDATATTKPTISGTWPATLASSLVRAVLQRGGRGRDKPTGPGEEEVDTAPERESSEEGTESDAISSQAGSGAQTPPILGKSTARQIGKVGGQRRKNNKRR